MRFLTILLTLLAACGEKPPAQPGTAERADLSAHLLGLVAGIALGAGIAAFPGTPPRAPTQLLLGGCAAACVVAAWLVALGS